MHSHNYTSLYVDEEAINPAPDHALITSTSGGVQDEKTDAETSDAEALTSYFVFILQVRVEFEGVGAPRACREKAPFHSREHRFCQRP